MNTENDIHKLYMAPMLGITDSAYRSAFSTYFGGFDCAIAPFIKTMQGGLCKDSKIGDVHSNRNKYLTFFPQILSNNSVDFIAVANQLYDLGYDHINVNFGCPVPMSAGRGRGAGLLPHVDFVDQFLDQILSVIPHKLSIKTRIGFDREDQLLAMTKVFNRYPLFEIAIHPRTAHQGYGGEINHQAFQEAAAELQTSIIYSGDINSLEDFIQLKNRYPRIRKWMLGRGALAQPLLPQIIQQYLGQSVPKGKVDTFNVDELADFYRHMSFYLEQRDFEPNIVLSRIKTLFYYHASHLEVDKSVIKKVRKSRNFSEMLEVLKEGHCRSSASLMLQTSTYKHAFYLPDNSDHYHPRQV